MSLNKEQRQITAKELQEHFDETTLSLKNIADELNISINDVSHVLQMKAPNKLFGNHLQQFIHLVWDVRDIMNENIWHTGKSPKEYTYLKDEKEDYWFLQQ